MSWCVIKKFHTGSVVRDNKTYNTEAEATASHRGYVERKSHSVRKHPGFCIAIASLLVCDQAPSRFMNCLR